MNKLTLMSTVCASLVVLPPIANTSVTIDYVYDDLGRLISIDRNDGPNINFTYDSVGNVVTRAITNSPDTDGDGEANFTDLDDDNDLLPDSWELAYGFDPLDAGDAGLDSDSDSLTNLEEFQLGLNPSLVDYTIGDINLDGFLDLGDYIVLQRVVLGVDSSSAQIDILADIAPNNGNGTVDLADLIVLQKLLFNN